MVISGAHVLDEARLLGQPEPIKAEKVGALLFSRHMQVQRTQVVHDCDDHYE